MDRNEQWNARYAQDAFLFGVEPNAFLKRQASLLRPGLRALAIADGEGRNGVWLARQGLDVLSIDVSENAQAKAAALAQSHGVSLELLLLDVIAWDWPVEAFDVVAAIFIQFAGPIERARIFSGIRRSLKPGGLLLLEGYRPEQLDHGTAVHRPSKTSTRRRCCTMPSPASKSSSWRSMTPNCRRGRPIRACRR